MKKAFFSITSILALAFVTATPIVRAQEPLVANIPFAFTAGKMTLPAGEYRVEKLAQGSVMLLIQRTDRSPAGFVLSNAADAGSRQTQSRLVLHRYGKRCFLSQVWVAGYSQGRELSESATEKEQGLAAHNEEPDQVTIVARLL
jgi:hypothetical protein